MIVRNVLACAAAAALALGCSDSGGAAGPKLKVNDVVVSGDVRMSGTLSGDDRTLVISLAAVEDPDFTGQPLPAADADFVVTTGPAPSTPGTPFTCDIGQVSAAAGSKADIVFINDTTGSMSGTVLGISDSVATFAAAIAASGVDARFSMYTYGDAFATKDSGPLCSTNGYTYPCTEFTVGKGDFALPLDLDDVERPYVGLSDLTTFNTFLAELTAAEALGSGGGDGPENTIGTLDYAASRVAWRAGASKAFIAIGDNPSHQGGDGDTIPANFWTAPFIPATGDDLVSRFAGLASIHVVGYDDTAAAPYYNLADLARGTGGAFLDLPYDGYVDLGALNLGDWFTNAFSGSCGGPPKGTYWVVIEITAHGTDGTTALGTLSFNVTIG